MAALLIADPVRQTTIHRFNIHQSLVHDAVEIILASKHAALVLKDPLEPTTTSSLNPDDCRSDPVTRWWFAKMNVEVRRPRTDPELSTLPEVGR